MMEVNRLPKAIISYKPRRAGTDCGLIHICRRIKLDTLEDSHNGSNILGFMSVN
jgi:hypothetical protein